MPDFEYDHLTLVWRQSSQSIHCKELEFGLIVGLVEPEHRCVLTFDPSPETASVIDCAIPVSAHCEPFGVCGGRFEANQGNESVMQYVLGFWVREAKGAPVKNQSGGSILVEPLAP